MLSTLVHLTNANVPILGLPPEITSLIFEMTRGRSEFDLDNRDEDQLGTGPESQQLGERPEMIVSRVCQQWRQVALSCPTIWSHLVIHNWSIGDNDLIPVSQRLSMYLTRSRGVPLNIMITIKGNLYGLTPKPCTNALRRLLLALLPHSTRWQRLAIWIDGDWNIAPLSCLEGVCVPQLEVFEVGNWPTWMPRIPRLGNENEDQKKSISLFQLGAPNLSSIFLTSDLLFPLYCDKISTVYLQKGELEWPWVHFTDLMSLPNLTNLTLDGPIFSNPTTSQMVAHPVVASNLRHFRLGCRIVFCNMWTTLSVPNLVLLILFDMETLDFIQVAGPLYTGFFPELKTLALWRVEIDVLQSLTPLCLATPQVTELIICDCEDHSFLMDRLYRHSIERSAHLWPHLRSLTYVVANTGICFGDVMPETYKAARTALLQLVNWRLRTFGQDCALWVDFQDHDDFLYDLPPFDNSGPEHTLWKRLFMPRNRRILPWPQEETIHFCAHERARFSNSRVRQLRWGIGGPYES